MASSLFLRRLHLVNAVLLLAGMAAVVAAWPSYPVADPVTLALFVVLGITTNLFVIPTAGSTIISLSDAVFLAASIVIGPPTSAIVMVASVTAGAINQGPSSNRTRRISQMLGNYGMYMIMFAAATWTYARLGGRLPIDRLSIANYLAALGFIVVYQVSNRLILYTRGILDGQSLREQLQDELEIMPLEVLDLHIGLLIAVTYVSNGFGPLVILGIAILQVSLILRRRVSMSQRLQQQVAQLSALNEIGRAISATVDIPRLMDTIYRESSKVIDTTNFCIALYAAQNDEVTFILDVTGGQLRATSARQAGKGLTEYVIHGRAPLLLAGNVTERARALGTEPVGKPTQCWLGVPMIAGEHVIGMIAAQNYDAPGAFTQEHVDILMTIAAQAAIAIQNARLLETVAQQERLRQELALARTIQQSLLPDPPDIPGLFIASRCLQAQETGGDLYDFIWIDEHHLGIVIGDVVGKGVPAALLMATVRSMLRAYAQGQLDPAVVLESVNRVMFGDTHGKSSVTLCYLVLDTQTWTLRLANAGHPSPLLCGDHEEPTYLDSPGRFPVGIQADLQCTSQVRALSPGEAILLYTDGIVEARDAQGKMLSFEGLQAILAQDGERAVDIDAILEHVTQFAGSVAWQDDLTLVVVRWMQDRPA